MRRIMASSGGSTPAPQAATVILYVMKRRILDRPYINLPKMSKYGDMARSGGGLGGAGSAAPAR